VYHPITSTVHYVEPSGIGITNTINRAELAAIAATVTHGYTHIATDSLSSLHQITKHYYTPNFTATMSKAISSRKLYKPSVALQFIYLHIFIYLYKVKSLPSSLCEASSNLHPGHDFLLNNGNIL